MGEHRTRGDADDIDDGVDAPRGELCLARLLQALTAFSVSSADASRRASMALVTSAYSSAICLLRLGEMIPPSESTVLEN